MFHNLLFFTQKFDKIPQSYFIFLSCDHSKRVIKYFNCFLLEVILANINFLLTVDINSKICIRACKGFDKILKSSLFLINQQLQTCHILKNQCIFRVFLLSICEVVKALVLLIIV